MSMPPYDDDPLDLEDEVERLEPGAGESVCERCGCHSWFVRWDYVLDADRTVRVQWTCGGHDSDDWCDRVAAVAERAEDENDEAFKKVQGKKEQAPDLIDLAKRLHKILDRIEILEQAAAKPVGAEASPPPPRHLHAV